jgi:hypothetical protein
MGGGSSAGRDSFDLNLAVNLSGSKVMAAVDMMEIEFGLVSC